MDKRFHIVFPLSAANRVAPFANFMNALASSLRELGMQATTGAGTWVDGATHIVLCPHLLDSNILRNLPPHTILYNLEQITPASPLPPARLWNYRDWQIWDFSPRNCEVWNCLGIETSCVPVGWHASLARVPVAQQPDIDLLFYGVLSARRTALLETMAARGLHICVANGVFGQELDALLARTKVVLNIHYYPSHLLETLRLSYLLGNGKAVISERSPRTEVPAAYESALAWSPYEQLPEACAALLTDADRQAALGDAGRRAMVKLALVPTLARALHIDPHDKTTP